MVYSFIRTFLSIVLCLRLSAPPNSHDAARISYTRNTFPAFVPHLCTAQAQPIRYSDSFWTAAPICRAALPNAHAQLFLQSLRYRVLSLHQVHVTGCIHCPESVRYAWAQNLRCPLFPSDAQLQKARIGKPDDKGFIAYEI